MPPRQRKLDRLVQIAAAHGQLASGSPLRSVQAGTDLPISVLANAAERPAHVRAQAWTEEEDDLLRQNLGWLPEDEIARRLGRTVVAVHLRWTRGLQLSAPSKHPAFITTRKIAEALGVDPKVASRWVDQGLLPGRRLPTKRVIRSVQRAAFQAWAANPMNWIYFRPERVCDPNLKRLLNLKARQWGDAWLTVGQAAQLRGVDIRIVNKAIHEGRLHGHKWGNWHLLRSEIAKSGLRPHEEHAGQTPKIGQS
jgi:hypothetical protein